MSRVRNGRVNIITNIGPRTGVFVCQALGVEREAAVRMAGEKCGMRPAMVERSLAFGNRFPRVHRAFFDAVLTLCREKGGRSA